MQRRLAEREGRPQRRGCGDIAERVGRCREAKAQAIVAYRDINGPFASVDELLEVKGIGKAILDRNREKLEVN